MQTFNLAEAIQDILQGMKLWRTWFRLAMDDLRIRYDRTRLGPIWLSLGVTIYIAGLGVIWGTLFKIDLREFFPYMAVGLIIWHFVTAAVNEGVNAFVGANGIIAAIPLPLTLHINRQVLRVFITLLHTLPVAIAVTVFAGVNFNGLQFLAIPALLILGLNCWWVTLLLGIVGARYRDVGQMITTVMPFVFFFTPILWKPKMLGGLSFLSVLNPFTHFIEIVRQPLLGQLPSMTSIAVTGAFTVLGIAAAVLVFARTRHRIAFWL
jgi:homopolymeric O-antigen transport system permease protein